ncbi:MAG: PTS sugar transporter subunit IIA [Spirochaetia bacterium]|jgi:fructose-specific phosphotransferase system IIA component|nr:PTS sugar transporter subunit IIA [Spirochaetia bacterium]
MAIIDLISASVVKVPLKSKTKTEVIRELVDVLFKADKLSDTESVFKAVIARENMGSTGLEKGIAVPHAKTEKIKNLTLAIGISPEGVDFDALDGEKSKLFFLLLAQPNQSGPHIEALAEIARITRSQNFCRMLTNASTPEEVVELFTED